MAGRPSNRDERYVQVMEALVRCVARFGLEGATLSAVAKEAGLSRPLIRHHLGNRDEVIIALQAYVLQTFAEQTAEMLEALPAERSAFWLVDMMFFDLQSTPPDTVLVMAALNARAAEDAVLQQACRETIVGFEAAVSEALKRQTPAADPTEVAKAALGISALYFNAASLASLNMSQAWVGNAYGLANDLVASLAQPK